MCRTFKVFVISSFLSLLCIPSFTDAATVASKWSDYEVVSSSFQFDTFSRTAVALDASGYLHVLIADSYSALTNWGYISDVEKPLYHQWYDGSQWQIETIDVEAFGGRSFSLGIDSTGKIHVCYIDNQYQVKYGWKTGETWAWSSLDVDASHPRSRPILSIDTNDNIHICYMTANDFDTMDHDTIRYSSNSSGTWQNLTAVYETSGPINLYGLLCNSSTQPVICYQVDDQHKTATYNAGLWMVSNSVTSMGYAADAAVDGDCFLHLCYYNSDGNLYYATNSSGSWTSEIVAPGVSTYYGYSPILLELYSDEMPAIEIDSSDTVHIFYREQESNSTGPLRQAYGQSGGWATETVAHPYAEMTACPLRNVADQYELVVYSNLLHGIEHFKKTVSDWEREIIAQAVRIDGPTTIVVDPNENPKIFHFDFSTKSLMGTSFDQMNQSVKTSGLLSQGGIPANHACEAQIDSAGNQHVLMTGPGYQSLNYWTDASGLWQSSMIDPNKSAGYSLALSPSGTAYVAYYHSIVETEEIPSGSGGSPSSFPDWTEAFLDWVTGGMEAIYDALSGNFIIERFRTDQLHICTLIDSEWQTEISIPVSRWSSSAFSKIDIDEMGNVHCIYAGNDANLIYLTNATGTWQQEQVDLNLVTEGESLLQSFLSFDLDSGSHPHIAYLCDDELKYARKQSGVWSYETLTSNTDIQAGNCTIELDASDKVYICYYDAIDEAVRLIQGGPGAWSDETIVDDCGDFAGLQFLSVEVMQSLQSSLYSFWGGYPSMILDSAGKVHISYYKAENIIDDFYNTVGSIHYVTNAFLKPGISVDPDDIYLLAPKNAAVERTVTVTSTGSGPLTLFNIDVTGTDASKFNISDDYTSPLNPGQECVITIDLDTSSAGTYEVMLNIECNDPAIQTVNIPLAFRCFVLPTTSLFCKITNYDFGSVVEGTQTEDFAVRVSNNGTTSLSLQSVVVDDNTNYTCENIKVPIPLDPGESYITWVRFNPQSTGRFDATLTIYGYGNALVSTSVYLTGVGIPESKPEISIEPPYCDFGKIQQQFGFGAMLFTIENFGDANLDIYELDVLDSVNYTIDPNAGKWSIGPDLPTVIEPKRNVTFGLIFHPTDIGVFDTSIKIFSNDEDEYKIYLPVTGQGTHWNSCDFNVDGRVNSPDFSIMASQWLDLPDSPPADVAPAKLDDWIDIKDLAFFAQEWLKTIWD